MRKSSFFLICLLLGSLLSAGCYYQKPDYSDEWDLTEKRKDSLDFEASHHYNRNYNFVVVGDSLCLQTVHPVHNPVHAGVPEDTVAVFADDRLVVAEVMSRIYWRGSFRMIPFRGLSMPSAIRT